MTVLHSGSTVEYQSGWENAFGKKGKKKTATSAKKKTTATKKKKTAKKKS